MHRFEGHHFASPFAPYFLVGGKQWIHTGDPVDILGLPTEKGGFSGTGKVLMFPLWEKRGKGDIWCMFDSP